ncbi:hypothetical protein ACQ4LK_25715, partial [Bacillus pumilus]
PKGYEPLQEVTDTAREFAKQSGAEVIVTTDPVAAVQNADVIYSDVFTSMGQELSLIHISSPRDPLHDLVCRLMLEKMGGGGG